MSSSREFVAALKDCATSVQMAEHTLGGHGEIMVALMSRAAFSSLPSIAQDFVREASNVSNAGMGYPTSSSRSS